MGISSVRPLKRVLNLLGLVLVSPAAATARLEAGLRPESQAVFSFWAHVLALAPGVPGVFLRRAYYRWTLTRCAETVTIEFGTVITQRSATLGEGVHIGAYALVGSAHIGDRSLIGSRASLLSGGQQHELLPTGKWGPTDHRRLQQIAIGPDAWIGEGSILMADVGAGCMLAAGSVVSSPVPDGVMMAGNPARYVRRLTPEEPSERAACERVPTAVY